MRSYIKALVSDKDVFALESNRANKAWHIVRLHEVGNHGDFMHLGLPYQ